MSHKQDKAAKRRAKVKARKVHAEQHLQELNTRIAKALIDLCADALPEYVDDSKGIDLVGRMILWRMGMVAWNLAVTGRREIDDASVTLMRVDEESRATIRAEINSMVRKKYERYPGLRTSIAKIKSVLINGSTCPKITLGDTMPEMPIPEFDNKPQTFTPEQIQAKRKELGLSQVKFAAALGVSVKKVSAWEHGKTAPDEAEMRKIEKLS